MILEIIKWIVMWAILLAFLFFAMHLEPLLLRS